MVVFSTNDAVTTEHLNAKKKKQKKLTLYLSQKLTQN